jgi:hypothetical protein
MSLAVCDHQGAARVWMLSATRRLWQRSVGFAIGLACLTSWGCAENEQSIFIRQVSVALEGDSCTLTADPSTRFLGRGQLDGALRQTYEAMLLIANQMTARASREQVRAETSSVRLEGSEVFAVEDVTGQVVFGPSTIPGSGFLDPGTGTEPSYGLLGSVLFGESAQSSVVSDLKSKVRASAIVTSHVRVFGHTLGETYVESGEFLFPIELCYGCLVRYPTDGSSCEVGSSTTTIGEPCIPGQDEGVDCRICKKYRGSDPVCNPG